MSASRLDHAWELFLLWKRPGRRCQTGSPGNSPGRGLARTFPLGLGGGPPPLPAESHPHLSGNCQLCPGESVLRSGCRGQPGGGRGLPPSLPPAVVWAAGNVPLGPVTPLELRAASPPPGGPALLSFWFLGPRASRPGPLVTRRAACPAELLSGCSRCADACCPSLPLPN